jgi:hypothetical protein
MLFKFVDYMMSVLSPGFLMTGSGSSGEEIGHSLRLRSSASAWLSRTFGTPTTPSKGCYSVFLKRGVLNAGGVIFAAGGGTASEFGYHSSNAIYIQHNGVIQATSTPVFRDPAAVYHIFIRFNGVNLTEVYVNNLLVVSWANSPNLLNTAGVIHGIGARPTPNNFNDCVLSRACFVDGGHTLTPSDFAYEDPVTGQWVSKSQAACKAVVDAGGANSFMLDFDNGTSLTTLGYDKSSKGNNWTLNNVSLTAGATYDWLTDTPTNNFCTLNPNHYVTALPAPTFSNGNLRFTGPNAGSASVGFGSIAMSTGKWYWESVAASGVSGAYLGIARTPTYNTATDLGAGANDYAVLLSSGQKRNNATLSAYTSAATATTVVGLAFDADAGTLTVYYDGVSQGVMFSGIPSGEYVAGFDNFNAKYYDVNFGQRPFAYTPPAGFKALCTKNLPTPSIKLPKKHFDVLTWIGNSATRNITGLRFMPGFVWIKNRLTASINHVIQDIVRGFTTGKKMGSNQTVAQGNAANYADNFGYVSGALSDGFTIDKLGTAANDWVQANLTGASYVGWCMKAGDSIVENTDGAITSQVSANIAAGFSVVSYTGNGIQGATVGHGLGAKPKLVIYKATNLDTTNWLVLHESLGNQGSFEYYLMLNSSNAKAATTTAFPIGVWNSSVLPLGTSSNLNNNGTSFVAYCFAEVPGFSKMGSYTGNGSTDGPFVWCGFRPRWLLIKRTDVAGNWRILDTGRDPTNVVSKELYPGLSNTEATFAAADILSNGFKLRVVDTNYNTSGGTYVFMALAEAPFNYANAR